MSEYNYKTERPFIFTEKGMDCVIRARDSVIKLLRQGGAFSWLKVEIKSGSSFKHRACLDYLEERGEITVVFSGYVNGSMQWVYVEGKNLEEE